MRGRKRKWRSKLRKGRVSAERFNMSFAVRLQSAALERVHRAAFSGDYPDDTNMNGFYSRTTLQRLCAALGLEPGRTLVDFGCGHGGTGLWVAQQTGVKLVGIDISSVGVALAEERATSLSLSDRARFQVGDLTKTALPDASCDAVLSLDVLAFVPDKIAALTEAARILRRSGTLGFTTWEQSGFSTRLGAEQCFDHRPLLEAAGFDVEIYKEPPEWRRQQSALAEEIIGAEAELAAEIGMMAVSGYLAMARGVLADMPIRRYVCIVARKR